MLDTVDTQWHNQKIFFTEAKFMGLLPSQLIRKHFQVWVVQHFKVDSRSGWMEVTVSEDYVLTFFYMYVPA